MEVNGWKLFQHPLFAQELEDLIERVRRARQKDPDGFRDHPASKLLATIRKLIFEAIPRDPSAAEYRQGNTLGEDNRQWFRAKFHSRYRLFFRFSSEEKVIVYVWMNDESSLRKTGSRRDPYAVFRSMLETGDPPRSVQELLRRSSRLEIRE